MKVSTGRTRTTNPLRIVADGRDDSLAASAALVGNLPLVLTSFVGRKREISEVEGFLAESRLLTLTGPGGCGKTRLALRVAAGLGDLENHGRSFGDGTWWVGLSSLPDAGLVPNAVATALVVSEAPDRTLTEALTGFLEAKELVLVLDNCEHLVDACAELADILLRSCPGLKVLATSREPLGVAGEVSLPEPKRGQDAEDLLRSESVRLFVERAKTGVPDFILTEENAPAVAALCRRLDGMPLAIELAASRVRVLSPEQILHRLDDRFRLLQGSRIATSRHRTLRATIDWSHELLSEEEKLLFRRLSVFAGGFTLVAAEEVCAGGVIEESEILGLLSCLVEKSLVMASNGGPAREARYRMLQTIQRYSSEELEGSREAEDIRRRHADFFLDLAEEAEPAMMGSEQAAWLERLEREHDNIRAALGWLREEKEAERGLRLAAALLRFWWVRSYLIEGRAQLEGLLDLCSVAPVRDEVRAKALHVLGVHQYADHTEGGRALGRSCLEEALEIYRRLGDEPRVAAVLQNLGSASATLGEWMAAHSVLEESLEIVRRLGDRSGIALSHFYLGILHLLRDALSLARAHFEEGLGILRELDDKLFITGCLFYLGYVDCEEGHHTAARSRFVEMNDILPLVEFPVVSMYCLEGFTRLASAEGQAARALKLGGATAALRRTYGVSIGLTKQAAFERGLERAWQAMGEKEGKAAWEEGRAMTHEEAIACALEDTLEEPAAKPETKPDQPSGGLLSNREVEVLSLVAEGLSDAEVAGRLYVSPRTVGGHLRGAYGKLGVKSRTAAINEARQLGLI